jgi:cysteine-rich repeat protein
MPRLPALLALALLLPAAASAVTLPLQGILRNAGGGPVTDGSYPMVFRLYEGEKAEKPLWDEVTVGIPVQSGLFSFTLGTSPKSPLDEALFAANEALWIGVQVGVEQELPRARLDQVAYAVRALVADKLKGKLDGGQIVDGTLPAKAVAFTYASSDAKGGEALGLKCTGCLGLTHFAPGVLSAQNIAWNNGPGGATVQEGLDAAGVQIAGLGKDLAAIGVGVKVKSATVGIGKAPGATCSLDVASDAGGLCVDGQPATVVRLVGTDAAMQKLAAEGQIAFRSDEQRYYGFASGAWRELAFKVKCGDKFAEAPEECDDGNQEDTDACTKACKKAVCGDKIVRSGVEDCDDGNLDNTDACLDSCKKASCGDGFILSGVEKCDGANLGTATCASLVGAGYSGTVLCKAGCLDFDTTGCKGALGSKENPAASCKAILDGGAAKGDGVYWLKNGTGSVEAFCDMAGGGWTLIMAWDREVPAQPWGTVAVNPGAPATSKKHLQPFLTVMPGPTEFRMVYVPNGQSFTGKMATNAKWETSSPTKLGARISLNDGRYLIFGESWGGTGGMCVHNAAYSDGYNCDGDSGQIAGQGLFANPASNEFGNCGTGGWKVNAGGNSASVCDPPGLVAVWLR